MNAVPRSAAERLGERFVEETGLEPVAARPIDARAFLRQLADVDWERAAPGDAQLSGADYRRVWMQLAGEPPEPVVS
jgi:hypothetical protein